MAISTGDAGRGRYAGARADGRGDVFPGLEALFWSGLLVGLLPSVVVGGLRGRFDADMLNLAGMGAGLGMFLGLFIGLARGVWRPGQPLPARDPEPTTPVGPEAGPDPSPQLWDPWVDGGRDLDRAGPDVVAEEPSGAEEREDPILARAPVRPRVISPETGEAIRLDDEIGPMLEDGRGGLVVLLGGPGSGKTTALQHLAAIMPPWARGRVRLLEVLDPSAIAIAGPDPFVILTLDSHQAAGPAYVKVMQGYTGHELAALDSLVADRKPCHYRLAPWDQDDAIEYLLATDRDACASVMGRLGRSGDFAFLEGIPELCTIVLDRMARDESIRNVRAALRSEAAARLDGLSIPRERIEDLCIDVLCQAGAAEWSSVAAERTGRDLGGEHLARLIRHRPAALLLATDRVAFLVACGRLEVVLTKDYPRELVRGVARQIAFNTPASRHLNGWIRGNQSGIQPLAASLLHAVDPGWRPDPDCRPHLAGAHLDGIVWPGQDLARVSLTRAELRDADLSGASLEKADAGRACLRGANLHKANLRYWTATDADLGRASLSGVRAKFAKLSGADLSGTFLIDADLWRADLTGARIEGADFTGANLEEACLKELSLRTARFDGARFGGANLLNCDLEDMVLTNADFHDANLQGAVLTGSRLPAANLVGADLRNARLAEIDWPGANLRDANLRGANFHLGSTRSGMLDSPIPCEGSRTGFYTDDFLDRYVKPAEEIRKANLRGADLRGADIRDVDFYLVDLRGARYTADQAEHLRRCRAILD